MITKLETENLVLRRPTAADWEPFKRLAMSERAKGIGGPYTHRQAWRQFAAEVGHWDLNGFGMFTVTAKEDDTALGMIGPWFPDDWPETEIGWMVYDTVEGKGIAYEAAAACVDHAFNTLGWDTIVHYIDASNDRSIALAKRLGAEYDPNARQPYPETPVHVYRHPKPAKAA